MRQITLSRRLAEVPKKKKSFRPLAGIHDPKFNNGDRHYCARPETDFKKKSKKTGKESTVKTATPVKCSEVIHYYKVVQI